VIDHAPDFAEAWNARATAWYQANRLGQSMADIEEVLARNPRHFGALSGMGIILEQLELYERRATPMPRRMPSTRTARRSRTRGARLDRRLQGTEL
jgi:tetratricopeptide (TPR) repeat protein